MCVCVPYEFLRVSSSFTGNFVPELIKFIRKTNTADQCSTVLEDDRVTTRNPLCQHFTSGSSSSIEEENQVRLRDCGRNTRQTGSDESKEVNSKK